MLCKQQCNKGMATKYLVRMLPLNNSVFTEQLKDKLSVMLGATHDPKFPSLSLQSLLQSAPRVRQPIVTSFAKQQLGVLPVPAHLGKV